VKAQLKRSGGVAGIPRRWELDERALASKQAQEFKRLLERAGFFALPLQMGSAGPARDAFCYELTVEDEGKRHTVKCAETAPPRPLWDCIEWILKTARRGA